jgi:putative transposase
MTYWRLFYHVVWTTSGRHPMIRPQFERAIHGILRDVAARQNVILHAIGGIEDHVHLALSIPPSVSISSAVGKLKGASSHEINRRFSSDLGFEFSWQSEFGVTSFSPSHLERVQEYINNQRQRHTDGNLHLGLEPGTRAS